MIKRRRVRPKNQTDYSIIRCPRQYVNKRNHRYVAAKVGDLVYYPWFEHKPGIDNRSEWKLYRCVEIEDNYDWNKKKYPNEPRNNYTRETWLSPVKRKRLNISATSMYPNVMNYNNKIWQAGFIGHGVYWSEYFHTIGEAMFNNMRRDMEPSYHIKDFNSLPEGYIRCYAKPRPSEHIKDYVPDYERIFFVQKRKHIRSKHIKDWDGIIRNTYIYNGRPSRHVKDLDAYRKYLKGE